MNVYLELIRDRSVGENFVIETFGVPDGFTESEYREYLFGLMQCAHEYYIVDNSYNILAYIAYNVSNDIHRKGDILDVHQLIINPAHRERKAVIKSVWKLIKTVATINKCDFISHYKHVNPSIINHITRRV